MKYFSYIRRAICWGFMTVLVDSLEHNMEYVTLLYTYFKGIFSFEIWDTCSRKPLCLYEIPVISEELLHLFVLNVPIDNKL